MVIEVLLFDNDIEVYFKYKFECVGCEYECIMDDSVVFVLKLCL